MSGGRYAAAADPSQENPERSLPSRISGEHYLLIQMEGKRSFHEWQRGDKKAFISLT